MSRKIQWERLRNSNKERARFNDDSDPAAKWLKEIERGRCPPQNYKRAPTSDYRRTPVRRWR